MKLTIRECTIDDLLILREISYKTYNDTFSHMNTPVNMKDYLEQAFHINKLRDKIEKNPREPRRIVTVWGVGYKYEAI